jgi:hypothetical protein
MDKNENIELGLDEETEDYEEIWLPAIKILQNEAKEFLRGLTK